MIYLAKGWWICLACIPGMILAQQHSPFKELRYDEQYALLANDSSHHTRYARFKYGSIKNAPFSIGGEARVQYFKVKNEDWGETPESTDGYFLSRFLLHANFNAAKKARIFTQIQGGRADWKKVISPIEQNLLDLHQAFVDYKLGNSPSIKVLLRLGRQELLYGSQRLISVREGLNYRQSFDGLRLIALRKERTVDLFYTHFVQVYPGTFNDRSTGNIRLWGLYVVNKSIAGIHNLDFYYLGFFKRDVVFQNAFGQELRHSLGSRMWNVSNKFSYDVEAVIQIGTFADKQIFAGTVSAHVTHKMMNVWLDPEIGLKSEIISGDTQIADQTVGTFNSLFPRGGYFGLAARFGPRNLMDIHPSLTVTISQTISTTIDYDVFWRYASNDGLYTTPGEIIYPGKPGSTIFIGDQLGWKLTVTPGIFVKFTLEAKWFHTGKFIQQAGPGKDILYAMAQMQLKF